MFTSQAAIERFGKEGYKNWRLFGGTGRGQLIGVHDEESGKSAGSAVDALTNIFDTIAEGRYRIEIRVPKVTQPVIWDVTKLDTDAHMQHKMGSIGNTSGETTSLRAELEALKMQRLQDMHKAELQALRAELSKGKDNTQQLIQVGMTLLPMIAGVLFPDKLPEIRAATAQLAGLGDAMIPQVSTEAPTAQKSFYINDNSSEEPMNNAGETLSKTDEEIFTGAVQALIDKAGTDTAANLLTILASLTPSEIKKLSENIHRLPALLAII